jgi:hypothetical protein
MASKNLLKLDLTDDVEKLKSFSITEKRKLDNFLLKLSNKIYDTCDYVCDLEDFIDEFTPRKVEKVINLNLK